MKSILVTLFLTAIPVAVSAADFAGTWKVAYTGDPRSGPKTIGSMIFDFKIDGGKVTGLAHIGSWPGLAPIAAGKVDGDHITFTATGYLPSTSGIPTCRLEGTSSGDNLVIKLSTSSSPGRPSSGNVYEYRGARLDTAAARAEKLGALSTLSVHRSFPGFADVEPQPPADFDTTLQARAPRLAANITKWEQVKPSRAEAESFSDQDLDDLVAFYNSSAGQAMIKTEMPAVETALDAFSLPPVGLLRSRPTLSAAADAESFPTNSRDVVGIRATRIRQPSIEVEANPDLLSTYRLAGATAANIRAADRELEQIQVLGQPGSAAGRPRPV